MIPGTQSNRRLAGMGTTIFAETSVLATPAGAISSIADLVDTHNFDNSEQPTESAGEGEAGLHGRGGACATA
jgi:hypothetical protein